MPAVTPQTRWLVRRDLPEVLEIERLNFSEPRGEEGFNRLLRERGIIGRVVEHDKQVVGYLVYSLPARRNSEVIELAVHPHWHRRGFGKMLLDALKGKMRPDKFVRIILAVGDDRLASHLFLRAQGFRATQVWSSADRTEDMYQFEFEAARESNDD